MFTIYFPNLKLPNNFINNHSWNKFQRNFLQSYRILQIIITYYKISESSIFFITFYLGFIAARIAKSALKFRERMRECLQSRTHDYEIEELEDDQRLVSRATSVFATGLDVLIVFPSLSFSTHPHGSFQVSPSTPSRYVTELDGKDIPCLAYTQKLTFSEFQLKIRELDSRSTTRSR